MYLHTTQRKEAVMIFKVLMIRGGRDVNSFFTELAPAPHKGESWLSFLKIILQPFSPWKMLENVNHSLGLKGIRSWAPLPQQEALGWLGRRIKRYLTLPTLHGLFKWKIRQLSLVFILKKFLPTPSQTLSQPRAQWCDQGDWNSIFFESGEDEKRKGSAEKNSKQKRNVFSLVQNWLKQLLQEELLSCVFH